MRAGREPPRPLPAGSQSLPQRGNPLASLLPCPGFAACPARRFSPAGLAGTSGAAVPALPGEARARHLLLCAARGVGAAPRGARQRWGPGRGRARGRSAPSAPAAAHAAEKGAAEPLPPRGDRRAPRRWPAAFAVRRCASNLSFRSVVLRYFTD